MKSEKILPLQLSLLLIGFIFGSTAIFNPASGAGHDAWLAFIVGWSGGFISIMIFATIASMNPGQTLVEILINYFGKAIGSIIIVFYIWYFLHLAALVLRNFGEYMVVTNYTETPVLFIMFCFIVVVAYNVKKGLEVFARVSELFVPVIFVFVIMIGIVLIRRYQFNHMLPFLENGIGPVIQSGFKVWTFPFGETVAFLMIFPNLNDTKKIKKISVRSCLVAGIIILMIVVRDLTVTGADMMKFGREIFTPNVTAQLITDNFQLETLISTNFLIGGGIKLIVCLYAASMGIAQLSGLDDFKPLVYPLAAFVLSLSIWIYDDIFTMFSWAAKTWPYYSIPFQFIIPIILLFFSLKK